MKLALPLLLTAFLALSSDAPLGHAQPHGHCAPYTLAPVSGDANALRVTTARGSIIARRMPQHVDRFATQAIAEFRVYPNAFDADGDTLGTVHDTIVVAPGTVVRWKRSGPGFHTITNGADSGDPNAAVEYSAIFDESVQTYERTFNLAGRHDFFCFIHEPVMLGSIIVTSATTDVGPRVFRQPAFSRSPSPNPSRGPVSFAIVLPRAASARLQVLDVSGRLVARLADGAFGAGEHTFAWDGRATDGRLADSGRYYLQLEAGGTRVTKALVRVR